MTAYLDTSALIKLYVTEPGSDAIRTLVSAAHVVATSSVAYPEARAALARLRRQGALSPKAFVAARTDFDDDWSTYFCVEATNALCRAAGRMADTYGLRGFDAVHLASFAQVADRAGLQVTRFASFDQSLNRAAERLRRRLGRAHTAD